MTYAIRAVALVALLAGAAPLSPPVAMAGPPGEARAMAADAQSTAKKQAKRPGEGTTKADPKQKGESPRGGDAGNGVEAAPGAIVSWSVPGTRSCGMGGKTWRAVQETCYYPIDVERKPGPVTVTRRGAKGSVARARVTVSTLSRETVNIQLGDIPQRNPSKADLQRNAREQARIERLLRKPEGRAQFTLPLAPPVDPLPEAKGFGDTWVFNTTPETTETHAGLDYAAGPGTPVMAMAEGKVVLAEDLFYSGNSVFVDHGNGLVTAFLHLAEITVKVGEEVTKGQRLGVVGQTGRTTGPHLHLSARWHGARVNPALLLGDPAKMVRIR